MRTVLFLTQTVAPVGGVQRWLDQLAQGLPRHGWNVVAGLAWGRFHDPRAFEAAHPAIQTLRLDGRSGTLAGRLLAIERAIRRVRPRVVVPVTLADPFEVLREMKAAGSDLRLFFGSYEISPAMLLDVRRYEPIIDRALGVSRATARLLTEVGGLPPERVDYVPPGYPPAPAAFPHPAPGRVLRLAVLGRLDGDKRPLDLLTLLAALDKRGLDWEALVVGDGALRGQLERGGAPWIGAGRLRLRPPVDHGALDRGVWQQCDVLLIFSPAEGGLPNVAAEALLRRVAVVTADFRGRALQGLLRDGETCLVFPVGDAAAAAACVARLAADAGLRRRLGEAGRAAVSTGYSLEAMLSGWALGLDAALAQQPARGHALERGDAPRDRLTRWLGRRAGERVRRLLGRTFVHRDAGEWPHCSSHDAAALRAAADAIDATLARAARSEATAPA